MSLTNDLYQEIARQKRLEEAAAKVRALKEELPTANEMRAWHDGANPAERHNETPYPSE